MELTNLLKFRKLPISSKIQMIDSYAEYISISDQSNRKYRPSESDGIEEPNNMKLNLFLATDF